MTCVTMFSRLARVVANELENMEREERSHSDTLELIDNSHKDLSKKIEGVTNMILGLLGDKNDCPCKQDS